MTGKNRIRRRVYEERRRAYLDPEKRNGGDPAFPRADAARALRAGCCSGGRTKPVTPAKAISVYRDPHIALLAGWRCSNTTKEGCGRSRLETSHAISILGAGVMAVGNDD